VRDAEGRAFDTNFARFNYAVIGAAYRVTRY
jgi:hypothetical protein